WATPTIGSMRASFRAEGPRWLTTTTDTLTFTLTLTLTTARARGTATRTRPGRTPAAFVTESHRAAATTQAEPSRWASAGPSAAARRRSFSRSAGRSATA